MMNDLPERLAARLRQILPARAAHDRLAPELSFGRHQGPALHDARAAAVVLLLYPRHGDWNLPLTVRHPGLTAHAGQISLPGGVLDQDESADQAALRELFEELGVPPTDVETLGNLSPLYLYGSNFTISPLVCVSRATPHLIPNPQEVTGLLEIPLVDLLATGSMLQQPITRAGITASAPYFAWQDFRIWGATAMIISELLELIREAGEPWPLP